MKNKELSRNCISLFLSITLILIGTCSCMANPNVTKSGSVVSSALTITDAVSKIAIADIKDIMFIGNSLTYVGEIPSKVVSLAKSAGKKINAIEKTPGGYKLSQHLADLKGGQYDKDIEKADAVILQEYGSFGLDTANSVNEIMKLFKPSTRFYFLLTEFDIPQRLTELKDVKNITYIPSGYAHNLLLNDGFIYDDLHAVNDYHPNALYGYIGALTVYSVVFQTSCLGSSYDFLGLTAQSLIFGLTKEEKDQTVKKIQIKVVEAVNAKQSDYIISSNGASVPDNSALPSQAETPHISLDDLPEKYTADMAVENGDYVILNSKIENSEVINNFLEKVSKRENSFVRKTAITIEGDAIITDITYEKRSFNVVIDSTRDKFGFPTIQNNTYARLTI